MTDILERTASLPETDTLDVPEGRGLMSMLSRRHGDLRVMWDQGNPEEVATARETFDRMTKKEGHIAYRVTGKKGDRGEVMRTFDPEAERIVFVKQNVGG